MTIQSESRLSGPYTGTGLVSSYPFTFKVFTSADLFLQVADTSGNTSTLVLTSDYSVSLNADQNANPGGTIALVLPLALNYTLIITSQLTNTQGLDIQNNGGFYPTVINNALDRLTILVQQVKLLASSSLKLPLTSSASATLPNPIANNFLGWNSTATALVNYAGVASVAVSSFMSVFVALTTAAAARAYLAITPSNIGAAASGANNDITSLNSPSIQSATCATQDQNDASTKVANTLFVARALNNKNLVINGDFKVAQRATSQSLTTSFAYGSVDRWGFAQLGAANGIAAQLTGIFPNFTNCLKLGRNSGATTTGIIFGNTAIETVDSIAYQGKQVTLSFYAKAGLNYSAVNQVLTVSLFSGTTNGDQSAANVNNGWVGSTSVITMNQALTTTLTRYQATAVVPANAIQLGLSIQYTPTNTVGNVGSAGADDNVYITGVQLELGPVATNFEYRKFTQELLLCQKYYEIVQVFSASVTGSTRTDTTNIYFKATKRTLPTLNIYGSPVNNTGSNVFTTVDGGSMYITGAGIYVGLISASSEL